MTTQTHETHTAGAIKMNFLSSGPKKLLIGGKWTDAESGATFESINPSTGQPILRLADGGAADSTAPSRLPGGRSRGRGGPFGPTNARMHC